MALNSGVHEGALAILVELVDISRTQRKEGYRVLDRTIGGGLVQIIHGYYRPLLVL